jgi:hypothetical protein
MPTSGTGHQGARAWHGIIGKIVFETQTAEGGASVKHVALPRHHKGNLPDWEALKEGSALGA